MDMKYISRKKIPLNTINTECKNLPDNRNGRRDMNILAVEDVLLHVPVPGAVTLSVALINRI